MYFLCKFSTNAIVKVRLGLNYPTQYSGTVRYEPDTGTRQVGKFGRLQNTRVPVYVGKEKWVRLTRFVLIVVGGVRVHVQPDRPGLTRLACLASSLAFGVAWLGMEQCSSGRNACSVDNASLQKYTANVLRPNC